MRRTLTRKIALVVLICFTGQTSLFANPIGAQVVSGTAAISQVGSALTVTNSPNAIINWQGFSINPSETTRFVQQSAASSVLNRVVGADPSQLLGTLTSNGRVFLINPAGILVGQGARIDVAGFVASTLNLSNEDFLAGRLNFGPVLNAGGIQNAGSITTPEGGTVYLVAPQVENSGIITTPKGETLLAAGSTVQLIDTGTPGVTVQVTGTGNTATNLGQILSDSGRIGMVGAAVKNSGTISASSLVNQGGRVFLRATQGATLDGGGRVEATGATGGRVEVLGKQVALSDSAVIDASGTKGGGTVLVGGDAHGANPDIPNAQNTFVGGNATIKADAMIDGDGGKVIVWADGATQFGGNISAQGGANGGNGGWVETSGKGSLAFNGMVNTTALHGLVGTLLLDPTNIYIAVDQAAATTAGMTGTDISVDQSAGAPTVFQTSGTPTDSLLLTNTLQTALGTNSVSVQTSGGTGAGAGNITVVSPVNWASANTLTLQANSNIVINAALTGANGGIVLNAPAGSISSPAVISANTLQITSSGNVSLPALNQVNTLASNVTAGTFSFENALPAGLTIGTVGAMNGVSATGAIILRQNTSGGITVNQNVASSAGDVMLGIASGGGGITTNAIVSGANTQVYTSGGAIAVNAGLTAATGTATLYSGAGAITTPAGQINANTIALQSNGGSGAIGVDFLNPLRTSAIGGAGNNSNIDIGFNATGPGAVYLSHTGDAVLNSVFTTGAAVPVNIEAIGNLTAASPISSGNGNVSLTGNAITFTAAGDIAAGAGTVNLASTGVDALTSIVSGTAISGADINIKTDNLGLVGTLSATNAATITRFNNNVEVQVGGAGSDGAGVLNVNSAEIANITAGIYRFGDTTSTGGLRVAGAVSITATKTLSLLTSNIGGSQIVQNPGATITADFLRAEGGSGVTLNEANAVANLSGKTLSGDFRFTNNAALNLSTVDGQAGIDAGASVWLTGVSLSQSANALITAASLNANATNGSVILTEANPVGVISGATTGGDFIYNTANQLTVSNVAGVNGISVPTANNIRLSSDVGINQNAGSVIKANGANGGGLALITAGPVFLDQANDVRTIAASLTAAGSGFMFANSEDNVNTFGDLVVGSLTVGGVTTAGITTNGGDINLDTPGLLTVLNPIAAGAGRVGLFADDLILSNTVTSTSEVGIAPYSANIPITVGAACGTPPCLSVTNLWRVAAPTIGIGEDGSLGGGGGANPLAGAISVAGITTGGTVLSDRHANTTRIGLFSGAGISQTGAINVPDLGVSAGTGVTLTGANLVGNLAGKTTTGPFQFTNAQTFNVAVLSGGSGFAAYSMPGIQAVSGDVVLTTTGATSDIVANSPQNYAAIIANNGNVTLNAGRDVLIGNSGGTFADIYAYGAGKNASVTAARDILLDNFSFILSEAGNVSLTATGGNVSIRSSVNGSGSWVGAGTAGTGGIVTISAPAGSVFAPAPGYGGDTGGGRITTGTGGELHAQAGGAITLNNTGNQITSFVGDTASSIDVVTNVPSLDLWGTVSAGASLNVKNAGGNILVNSTTSAPTILLDAANGITLGSASTLTATGPATIILNAGTGGFVNNSSAGVDVLSTPRWLVYAASPASVTKGGLTSDFRHYNGDFTSYPPASVTETGNGFIYAQTGILNVDTTLVSGTASHIYGATPTAVFGYAIANPQIIDSEDLALITGTPVFTPTISSATAAGNYMVSYASGFSSTAVGVTFGPGTGLAYTVSPATLITAVLTGTASKTYDGTTTATLAPGNFLLSGFVGTDSATVTQTVGAYASKNVGSNIPVSVTLASSDFSPAGGTNLANYTLPTTASGNIGVITPAALTVSGMTASSKVYDGTTAATLTGGTLTGILGADIVSLAGQTGTFADKNAGLAKPVVISGITLTGADAPNYTVSGAAVATADITPATISAVTGITAQNKVYDATTAVTLNTAGETFTGMIAGDLLAVGAASGAFADKNAGLAKPVAISGITLGGADALNYILAASTASTVADITPASLTISGITATSKVYDGTAAATLAGVATIAPLGGDAVILGGVPAASFADANAAAGKPVTVTGYTLAGADAGNYTLMLPAGFAADITPAMLTVTANNATKVFDGLAYTGGNGVVYAGFVNGETELALGGVLTYGGTSQGAINAGAYLITPGGLTSGNYAISFLDGTLAVSQPITVVAPVVETVTAATTTATNAATTATADTITATDPTAATAPIAIDTGAITVTSTTSGAAPTMAGPAGGTIGGTAGTFGGDSAAAEPTPSTTASPAAPAADEGAAAKKGDAEKKDDADKKDENGDKDKSKDKGRDKGKDKDNKDEDKPSEKPEKC